MEFSTYSTLMETFITQALDRACISFATNRAVYTPPTTAQEAEIFSDALALARRVNPGEGLTVLKSDIAQVITDYKDFKQLKSGNIPRFKKRINEPHDELF